MGFLDRIRRKRRPLAIPDPEGRYTLTPTAAYWAEMLPVVDHGLHGVLADYDSPERAARMPPRSPAEQAWYDAARLQSAPSSARDLISTRLTYGTWTRDDLHRDLDAWLISTEKYLDAATRARPGATPLDLERADDHRKVRTMQTAALLGVAILTDADTSVFRRAAAIADRYEPDRLTDLLLAARLPDRSITEKTQQPFLRLTRAWERDPRRSIDSYLTGWWQQFSRPSYFGWAARREHFDGRLDWISPWCFEAAAVAVLLDVDDTALREREHYPAPLVDLYRTRLVGDA